MPSRPPPPHFYHTSLLNLTDCRYVKGEDSYSSGRRKEEKRKQSTTHKKPLKKSIVNTYLIQLQFGCFFILWTDWQDDIITKNMCSCFCVKEEDNFIVFNIGIDHWCSQKASRFLFLQIFSYFLISNSIFAPSLHQTEEFPCARPPQCNTFVSSRTLKWAAAVWCCPLGLLISD